MSIFAGVVAVAPGIWISAGDCDALQRALTRQTGDHASIDRGPAHWIGQVELPARGYAGRIADTQGRTTLLAGRPLFASDVEPGPSDVQRLHAALLTSGTRLLDSATGSFCAVQWDPVAGCVTLVADKLGVRPLYYAICDGYLYFSTAQRVLESIAHLVDSTDERGVAEFSAFGYPLADRTPFARVRCLQSAEIVRVAVGGATASRYWHWERLPPQQIDEAELPGLVHRAFVRAIERRLDGERSAVAMLSGGLDSRCIVAVLRALGVSVHTLNFAPPSSEDLVLGRLCAQALGSRHFEFPRGPLDFWDRMKATFDAWLEHTEANERPANPYVVWSGDGGSCGLGHIYLNPEVVRLMQQHKIADAVDEYLDYNRIALPRKLLLRAHRDRLAALPSQGVIEELDRLRDVEPGRRFHSYLMQNGQRRLLVKHYENIDLRRFELSLPFFDSDFVRLVLGSPIEGFLRHGFYVRWLREFAPEVATTPWQAYPGHVACPVAVPPGLRNQWDGWYDDAGIRQARINGIELGRRVLRDGRFPRNLLDRKVLRLALWLTRLGWGDYSHVFKCADVFTRYSRVS